MRELYLTDHKIGLGWRKIGKQEDLLIAYSNRWNWSRIINHYGRCETFEGRGISFYEQFKDYIPEAKLQDSSLWNEIVEQTKKQIINDIVVKG